MVGDTATTHLVDTDDDFYQFQYPSAGAFHRGDVPVVQGGGEDSYLSREHASVCVEIMYGMHEKRQDLCVGGSGS